MNVSQDISLKIAIRQMWTLPNSNNKNGNNSNVNQI